MTNRFYALTVILEKDVREDDCEPLIDAIKILRGVLDVKPHIANPDTWMAEERARQDLGTKILKALHPKNGKE